MNERPPAIPPGPAPRRRWIMLLVFAATAGPAPFAVVPAGGQPSDSTGIPGWVLDDMARRVGRWVADNTAYRSDGEPFDAYGMEWTWGLGRMSVTGRLFGLQDGEEQGTFWEFRQVWHPGTQQLMLYQFGGDGTLGVGPIERIDAHTTRSLQTFHRPDGTAYRVGHRTTFRDDEEHSRSYDVDENDVWTERRSYVWRRVADGPG